MQGSKILNPSDVRGASWYYANTKSAACTNGFNQEETIKAIWNAGSGTYLAVWWKFDETNGTSSADSSGSGNAGTLTLGIYGEATRLVTSSAETDPLRSRLARAVLDALAGEGGA